ncbi:MAG TPA: TetR/AcrR family transcriptional regulator [Trebonia sp.]|nr:TetR/AcrR family transcriptional regulator [Trebonia sp.]
MTPPNASMTARERARAELTREIKDEARRQLVTAGADGLSLRAVAKSLGMVSSALYRYFPSRDALLTELIIDAYNSLGAAVEESAAAASGGTAREQWLAAARRVRDWARARPHEYALIYGSPVPGYQAPEATIGPAARVPLVFTGILERAATGETGGAGAAGESEVRAGEPLAPELSAQAAALAAAIAADGLPGDVLVRGLIAWTQLFGMVSFELFGQFVGSFEPADAFFEHAIAEMAAFVGL